MSMIGLDILHGFSKFIGDYWVGETSTAGTTTTMVDDKHSRFGDDSLVDFYVRPIQDQNIYEVRRLDSFISSSGTMTFAPAYTVAPQIFQKYELHRYDPAIKYQCIDEARYRVIDDLFKIVYDETLTGDGHSNSFDIPSSVRHGPVRVYEETPIGTNNTWNLLNTADLDAPVSYTHLTLPTIYSV